MMMLRILAPFISVSLDLGSTLQAPGPLKVDGENRPALTSIECAPHIAVTEAFGSFCYRRISS